MTTENSPSYATGQLDGQADGWRIQCCPPNAPIGPTPPNPDYPVMYNRGYHDAFDGFEPHLCTDRCRKAS